MQNLRDKVDNLQLDISITKDLSILLDEHFQATRYKENPIMDNWSITHLFSEYTTLNYMITNKLNKMEELVAELVRDIYKLEGAK